MNRSWAGFDFEDYYRAGQIAMGILDEDLEVDLETEYLPEAGRKLGGLVDDHGISRIAQCQQLKKHSSQCTEYKFNIHINCELTNEIRLQN